MTKTHTDLPFGDAFSPAQLKSGTDTPELVRILELVEKYKENPVAFDKAVGAEFFKEQPQPRERGRHVRNALGPAGYRIVTDSFELTKLGENLLETTDSPDQLYEMLAAHILRNLHGLQLLKVVRDLEAGGAKTTEATVKDALRDRFGLTISEYGNAISQMRGWLEKAGIASTGTTNYEIDWERVYTIMGTSQDEIEKLEVFDEEQKAFLRALSTINPAKAIPNTEIRELAEEQSGVDIRQGGIRRNILDTLSEAGYLTLSEQKGQPIHVKPTEQLRSEVLGPILAQLEADTGLPRVALRLSFSDISDALENGGSAAQRKALDALGIQLGRLLNYTYVARRTTDLGRDHLASDIIVEDRSMNFVRWHIRTQSTSKAVTPAQLLEATAVSRLAQANTLVFVTQSKIRENAARLARQIMAREQLTILLIENPDIARYDTEPSAFRATLKKQTRAASHSKRFEIEDLFSIAKNTGNQSQSNLQDHDHGLDEYLTVKSGAETEEDLSDFI